MTISLEIQSYIEQNKQELFQLLSDMIRINTENTGSDGRETPLALYMSKKLRELGVDSCVYSPDSLPGIQEHPDYSPGRQLGERMNITAQLPGTAGGRSLMLAAHLDTVPIGDPSLWTVPPTEGLIRDGRIYGRGACDDKYALAAWLFLVRAFRELGVTFRNDLYFSGYVDEEFGGGNGALACCLKYPCDYYLNLDGDDFDIWNHAVGGQRIALYIRCDRPLASCERMIDGLMLCRERVDAFGARRKAELAANEGFRHSDIPASALRYLSISSGVNTNDRNKGCLDFAFYTDRDRQSITEELDRLFKDISGDLETLGLSIERVCNRSRFFHYGSIEETDANLRLLRSAAKASVGRELAVRPSCLSDLSLFLGCAPRRAFAFGAGRDFDVYGGAHLPDEFIECDKLVEFTKILASFLFLWDEQNG